MSEHKHTFTFRPVGSIDDQPNAVRRCECGKDLLDAYQEQHEEIERLKRERDEWKQKYLDTREGRLNALRESEAPTDENGNARPFGE